MSHKRTMPVEEAVKVYREKVRAAVERYGPGGSLWKEHQGVRPLPIRYWQIWNEPNIEFLNPGQSGLLRTQVYAKLLKAASEEIRKADPGARIIAFNTAGGVPYHGRGVPPDGVFAYRLKGWDGRPVIMAWNAGHGMPWPSLSSPSLFSGASRPVGPPFGG